MCPEITPPGPLLLREVSKMRIVFLDADDVRIRFEAACKRLGEGDARRAFSMALNKEGRKSFTAMRRALSQQSSIPRGAVNAAMRFKGATPTTLSVVDDKLVVIVGHTRLEAAKAIGLKIVPVHVAERVPTSLVA